VRLETLESEFGDTIEIEWRSFLLQPQPRPKPLDKFMAYTLRWVQPGGPGDLEPECGFKPWQPTDDDPPTHSLPAAIAGKIARDYGKPAFDRFHLATMRAYFVEHRTISDPEVLADIAERCDLPRTEFSDRLHSDAGAIGKRVIDEHNLGIEADVHAVPSVVVNGFPIPGAQEVDTYRAMINRVLARMEQA
jgi:predicted DsbA family dithiol-disulfide isomerase